MNIAKQSDKNFTVRAIFHFELFFKLYKYVAQKWPFVGETVMP
jgi:hypothetical protein